MNRQEQKTEEIEVECYNRNYGSKFRIELNIVTGTKGKNSPKDVTIKRIKKEIKKLNRVLRRRNQGKIYFIYVQGYTDKIIPVN